LQQNTYLIKDIVSLLSTQLWKNFFSPKLGNAL